MLSRAKALHGTPAPESSSPWYVPNQWLAQQAHRFRAVHLHEAFDETRVRAFAANGARLCERQRPAADTLLEQCRALVRRQIIAESNGIPPPEGPALTLQGRLQRLESEHWWRRQVRKRWTRAAENEQRAIGLIRRGAAPYASDAAVSHRHERDQRKRDFLQRHAMANEAGEQLSLFGLAEKSLANPALRRGEFMCRIRGMEERAHAHRHVADFWTLTVPSAYHAQLAAAGGNPAYQRQTVREAQAWLCRLWARARAWMKRKGVHVYGVRVAEPHHDATPHWHLLVFGKPEALKLLQEYLPRLWLSDRGDEPGAARVRTKHERIDAGKGSAVGYVAKYISKNIDSAGTIGPSEDLETGTAVHANSIRVLTWAQIHGIRQFQQIGAPPIGLWREIRRLREPVADPDIETTRQFADRGDYGRFVQCIGGIHAGRKTNLKLYKQELGQLNQYQELKPAQVVGLQWAGSIVLTRPHHWRIEKCGISSDSSLAPWASPPRPITSATAGAITTLSVFGPTETVPLGALRRLRDSCKGPSLTPSTQTPCPPESPTIRKSDSDSGSESALGPVAITVRGGRYILAKSRETGIWGWWAERLLRAPEEDCA